MQVSTTTCGRSATEYTDTPEDPRRKSAGASGTCCDKGTALAAELLEREYAGVEEDEAGEGAEWKVFMSTGGMVPGMAWPSTCTPLMRPSTSNGGCWKVVETTEAKGAGTSVTAAAVTGGGERGEGEGVDVGDAKEEDDDDEDEDEAPSEVGALSMGTKASEGGTM